MLKIVEVAKVWITSVNPNPEQKILAEYRASICDSCEHKAHNASIDLYYCGKCGCPLSKKIFSPAGPNACPDKRWEK